MKDIVILGSTGSIGRNAVEVVLANRNLFKVRGLSTNKNIEELSRQIELLKPEEVVICDERAYESFMEGEISKGVKVHAGEEELVKLACKGGVDLIVNALIGFVGFLPTVEGIKQGKDIAIANKESIIVGNGLIPRLAKRYGVNLIPVDSEHNAILFLLGLSKRAEVKKLLITASGGPFREHTKSELEHVTVKEALKHPTWEMGDKITIDSATLINKGFEVLEAHYLFGFALEDIEVVIHKESIIHSMVETVDGSIYAQLGMSDMRIPIQNAMTYPDIIENEYKRLNLVEIGSLNFSKPDYERFPLLKKAYEVGHKGGIMPTLFNASNEVSVKAFLDGQISYKDINLVVSDSLREVTNVLNPDIEDILKADYGGRERALELIKSKSKSKMVKK